MAGAMMAGRWVQTLDGVWDFRHDSDGVTRLATVPLPWQAEFADLRQASGRATYARRFGRPALAVGQQLYLCFGAVSYLAEVRVNGHLLGSHEGGYLPFDLPIPADVLRDDNAVEVACLLPDGNPDTAGIAFAEIPHGKQSWYGPIGGIWQSVRLEAREAFALTHCAIVADPETGVVSARLSPADVLAEAVITGPDGGEITRATGTGALTLTVPNPALWSPDTPNLYSLTVTLTKGDARDVTGHIFGFRSIETRDGQILLNGQPFYMRAALDQDYYPEGICTPPSLAFLEDQVMKAKALGLNMLRCHIKVPDPRYYEVADRLGMLIWTEIPNVGSFTEASAKRMVATMEGILARDGNHPSIVIWTLINEDWGTRLCEDASHRAWLKQTFDWLKAKDPTRLVVDNSPCHGNFHVKSDLNDFHYYRSVPERRAEWDALTREFAGAADWTYTPFGDGERQGDEPLVVSEFGVWGLPDPAKVQINGAEPWWMETGQGWGDGAAYPHGIEARFAALRLGTVFKDFGTFIDAVQWYQFANLKYQIEVMRAWPQIQGYVITEFTDVHWESNGLLDMNRNPRVFHESFASINADVVIVPDVPRYAGVAGDQFSFGVKVATGGLAVPASELRWQTDSGAGGTVALAATPPLATADLGEVGFTLPETRANRMLTISLTLLSGAQVLARNEVQIALYARRATANLPSVGSTDAALAAHAAGLGYIVVAPEQAQVTLVHALDKADIARMQAGARYVVLADGSAKTQGNLRLDQGRREQPFIQIMGDERGLPPNAEGTLPNIPLTARHGTMWRGDWIAGVSWIRRAGAFADLPGGPLIDLSFSGVVPHHVMGGFRAWEYGGPVHSGLVVGWVHKPAVLIGERRVGRGGLAATTFRLRAEPAGADPVASHLFDAMIRLALDMRCEPPLP